MTTDLDLVAAGACEIADAVRAGTVSAVEVTEAALQRVDKRNAAINAFVFVDPERALAAAAAVDRRVAAGEDPGRLAGVPLGIKELEEVEGWPHTKASTALRNRIGRTTGTSSVRLMAAGAIPLGLTASPEIGLLFFTNSVLHGATRNPWNLERTPGGSSGGAGAALAAGLVSLATGSDQGGSIRLPAGWCGVVGVKGTYGRVPRGPGWIGPGNTIFYGPLARSVVDAARYLDCVMGVSTRDVGSLPAPAVPYEQALTTTVLEGAKIAVFLETGATPSDPGVRTCVADAAADLIGAARLQRVEGLALEPPDIMSMGSAILFDDADPAMAEHMPEILGNLMATEGAGAILGLLGEAGPITTDGLSAARTLRHQLNMHLAELLEQVDLLVLPVSPVPAFGATGPIPTVIDGQEVGPAGPGLYTSIFNLSGHPVVAVPAGMVDGAPVGMQIVARRHEDHLALAAAAALERCRPWPKLAPFARQ